MPRLLADVVEDVKQPSVDEMEELQKPLRKYLIEERRRDIRENAEAGLKEYRGGTLEVFSNIENMMGSLCRRQSFAN